jgi:ABC-2 type transport system permease protein
MKNLKKYFALFSVSWQNGLVYPISLLVWRLRQFIVTFMSLTLWTVIFSNQNQAFGYGGQQMITYIFLVGFLQSVILATVLNGLAEDIYTGKISNEMVKPVNFFWFLVVQDLADKLKNFTFIIIESIILFLIFRPQIVLPSLPYLILFFTASILGAGVLFFIMLLFGVIGFWSNETWGPRFLFFMFLDFTAGKLYPLNILPTIIQKIIFLTPFPYLSYIQTQIFLGRLSLAESLKMNGVIIFWVVLLGLAFRHFWRKGLKEYGALGR